MNILPKKSWHVRNKDNIARVRRDEENARLEEEKLAKRAALAEQEARTKLLRERVKSDPQSNSLESSESTSVVSYDTSVQGHINLFYAEETGSSGATRNTEYEAEKKAEQEKKEKALGVLKYLGQITNEDSQPWYLHKDKERKESKPHSQDLEKKNNLDPLVKMNAYLDQTKQTESQKKEKRKKEKKQNKKSKKGKKTILELRAERLQREKEERLRAEKLIKEKKEGKSGKTTEEDDPYRDGYYSQYNPELAKKPKWNRRQCQPY